MPRKLPPFVERWRDRHGKVRVYFRRGKGRRVTLPDLSAPEFDRAYQSALLGSTSSARPKREAARPGTIGALVISYLKSAGYLGLRKTSKVGYAHRIEHLRVQHGHRTVSGLTRERIMTGILQPFANRPGSAHATLKMLRILIRHAIDIGWLAHDPSLGIKRPKLKRIRSWTESEIEQYRAHWPFGTKQRTAFELFLNTGQRRSDVVRMAWPHIVNGTITVEQQKTGRKLLIPLHRDALTALEETTRAHIVILTTAYGRPFTVDGFSQWMRDAIAAAGLPLACQPHGLRKATGRRLAEAGATAKEIMAILGHTTLSEAERYTEDADQAALAIDAVRKLQGQKWNGIAQTSRRGLGKIGKTKGKSKWKRNDWRSLGESNPCFSLERAAS